MTPEGRFSAAVSAFACLFVVIATWAFWPPYKVEPDVASTASDRLPQSMVLPSRKIAEMKPGEVGKTTIGVQISEEGHAWISTDSVVRLSDGKCLSGGISDIVERLADGFAVTVCEPTAANGPDASFLLTNFVRAKVVRVPETR